MHTNSSNSKQNTLFRISAFKSYKALYINMPYEITLIVLGISPEKMRSVETFSKFEKTADKYTNKQHSRNHLVRCHMQ